MVSEGLSALERAADLLQVCSHAVRSARHDRYLLRMESGELSTYSPC